MTATTARTAVYVRALLGVLVAAGAVFGFASPASGSMSGTLPTTQAAGVDPNADIVIFWGDGCPNCEKQEAWLATVEEQHPDLAIARYEVWNSAENRDLFAQAGEDLGFEAGSVPTAIIGERVWIGWTNAIEQDMAGAISLLERGELPKAGVYGTAGAGTCSTEDLQCSGEPDPVIIDVPFVGEVSLGNQSLLVSTIIIGFVDGVNPCSLWVLSVLLTIVLRTSSRPRVIAIGTTFLALTAAMYGLYMAAFYSALSVVGYLGIIQWVVALVAGLFGVVSVKDYFAFKKGLSFTISDSAKPGIYRNMREAAGHKALLPALGATIVLAVGVSLLETPCTAGFPVLWTGMLHAAGVGPAETAFLFVAYMVPFLIDELIIFGIAVATMKSIKMQDKHGEFLKLFAGVTMLALASTMVLSPALMENPVAALALFAAAFSLAIVIHLVATKVRARRGAQGALPAEETAPTHH